MKGSKEGIIDRLIKLTLNKMNPKGIYPLSIITNQNNKEYKMKEQIKELRVKIDGLSQLVKELEPIVIGSGESHAKFLNSKEIEKGYDSLILSKAWLGKVLGELGESTPYVNDGKRKTVEDIEPVADKANMNLQSSEMPLEVPVMINWSEKSHIEKVDWLRQEIQHLTHLVYQYCVENSKTRFHSEIAYRHLCEARFWLGLELGRIRDGGK